MKGFALVSVAVLAVVAIGVGLVGGLPKTTPYLVGGARFSIEFPTMLRPHATIFSSQVPPCTAADVGTADQGRLVVSVVVFEEGGSCFSFSPSSAASLSSSCTSHEPSGTELAGVTVRAVQGSEYCLAGTGVARQATSSWSRSRAARDRQPPTE